MLILSGGKARFRGERVVGLAFNHATQDLLMALGQLTTTSFPAIPLAVAQPDTNANRPALEGKVQSRWSRLRFGIRIYLQISAIKQSVDINF